MKHYVFILYIIFGHINLYSKYSNYKKKGNNILNNSNINKKNEENIDNNDKKKRVITLIEFYKEIFECLNKKKLFFTNDERNNVNFKKFVFLKNCDENKNNRCWFITSVMCYLNIPVFQEIILNNNFDDNKYLKCLQKLCLEMRSKNNFNKYVNFDELYNMIATDLNIIGKFYAPLDTNDYEHLLYNKVYKRIQLEEEYYFKEDQVKNKNLEEILKYNICNFIMKNLNIDCESNYCVKQNTCKNKIFYFAYKKAKLFLFFFEEKDSYERFFDILNFKYEKITIDGKDVIKNYDEFIKKKQEIYNEIINSFNFSIHSISIFTGGNHFFSICKNPEDNKWYNFNSLSGHNGDIVELNDNFINNNFKNNNENIYFITIKRKK